MKTYYKYIVVFVTIAMVLSACATATEAPAAATVSPTEPESAVPTELKDMTWDQIVAQAKTGDSQNYIVRRGDSPYLIARRHRMNLYEFLRINNLTVNSTIFPGQEVKVISR